MKLIQIFGIIFYLGRLSWPVAADGSDRVTLSHEELSLLLGGIDLRQTRQKNWYRVTVSESEKV